MTFPVSWVDFLRLAVGGKYLADREKIYRDFWRHQIRAAVLRETPNCKEDSLIKHVEKVVEENMHHWRTNGFDQSTYEMHLRAVTEWLPGYKKERRSKRALDNANKRWENKD